MYVTFLNDTCLALFLIITIWFDTTSLANDKELTQLFLLLRLYIILNQYFWLCYVVLNIYLFWNNKLKMEHNGTHGSAIAN